MRYSINVLDSFVTIGCMMDNIEIVGESLFDDSKIVQNHHDCIEECNKTPQCNTWTLKEGFCYLKNESGVLKPGGIKTFSGSKNCNISSGMRLNNMQYLFLIFRWAIN